MSLSQPPFQVEEDLAALIDAMRADAEAAVGPIELARRGVEVVLRLTEKEHYERPLHIWIEVQGLARALFEARRDCMPLSNLASATVEPLPELYGRGKDEGARMRSDLRARTEAWLAALERRAARIDAIRSAFEAVTAGAIDVDYAYVPTASSGVGRYVVGGFEKFVPPNYEFPTEGFTRIPLDDFNGVLTGDSDGAASVESVRAALGSLRFATILL